MIDYPWNSFTDKQTKSDVKQFNLYLSKHYSTLPRITPKLISNYIKERQCSILRGTTISKNLYSLKKVLSQYNSTYAEVVTKAMKGFNQEKYNYKPRKIFTKDEIEILLNETNYSDKETYIYIRLALATACRSFELINIKISDIDFDQHIITIHGKGKKYRQVIIDHDTKGILYEHIKNTNLTLSDNLFTYTLDQMRMKIYYILKKYNMHNNNGITHAFRHTAATLMHENGMPIEDIQYQLGHTSIEQTKRYIKTSLKRRKEMYKNHGSLVNI